LDQSSSLFTPHRPDELTQAVQFLEIVSDADQGPFQSSFFFSVKKVKNLLNADININININIKSGIKR
jgi:hypothetical protein